VEPVSDSQWRPGTIIAGKYERAPAGETFARMLGRAADEGELLDDLHQAPRRDLEFLTYLVRGSERGVALMIVARSSAGPARA